MRRALSWLAAVVVALIAVVGLITFFNSRDAGSLSDKPGSAAPGKAYRGEPVLSPADQDAVKRGNVVVLYRDPNPPRGTDSLIPPGGKPLVEAGQSVVLDREPTLHAPLAGVSSKRIELAQAPEDLRPFVDYWIGR